MKLKAACIGAAIFLAGCVAEDPNAKPTFGEESGLPKNCRAIVQSSIDSYRNGNSTADDAMNSLERNCGTYGYSWGE